MQSECAILSSVACPSLQYFSTLSHKGQDIRKRVTGYIMFAVMFPTALYKYEKNFIIRITERDMIRSVYWSSYKVTVILFAC